MRDPTHLGMNILKCTVVEVDGTINGALPMGFALVLKKNC